MKADQWGCPEKGMPSAFEKNSAEKHAFANKYGLFREEKAFLRHGRLWRRILFTARGSFILHFPLTECDVSRWNEHEEKEEKK